MYKRLIKSDALMMNENLKKLSKRKIIIYTSVQSEHKLWLVQIFLVRSWHMEDLRGGRGGGGRNRVTASIINSQSSKPAEGRPRGQLQGHSKS